MLQIPPAKSRTILRGSLFKVRILRYSSILCIVDAAAVAMHIATIAVPICCAFNGVWTKTICCLKYQFASSVILGLKSFLNLIAIS